MKKLLISILLNMSMLCAMENVRRVNIYDVQNDQGRNDLHIVASNGDIVNLKIILKTNPNLNLKTNRGNTPLDKAIEQGHVTSQKLLRDKATEYLFAAFDKHTVESIPKIKDALKAGADINAIQLNGGKTPLGQYLAHTYRQTTFKTVDKEIIQLLLDAGASLDIVDASGYKIFEYCPTKTESCKDFIVKAASNRHPVGYYLTAAIQNGSLLSVQTLLQNNQMFASREAMELANVLGNQTQDPVYRKIYNLFLSHNAAARSDIRNIAPEGFPLELLSEIIK
jgi:ankyrin repeat protein